MAKKETRVQRIFRQRPDLEVLYVFKKGIICTNEKSANKQKREFKKGEFKKVKRNG